MLKADTCNGGKRGSPGSTSILMPAKFTGGYTKVEVTQCIIEFNALYLFKNFDFIRKRPQCPVSSPSRG